LLSVAIVACGGPTSNVGEDASTKSVAVESTKHDTSPPLREMIAAPAVVHDHEEDEGDDTHVFSDAVRGLARDVLAQDQTLSLAPSPVVNFEAMGNGMPGGTYSFPPDTVSAAGSTQIVEIVNSSIAVWNKSGTLVYGPKPTNTIFAGFGAPCETTNDGDARVRYDAMANRWVVTYFSYFSQPYGVCVAVSSTNDATGAWHRYFFQFNAQTDYPVLGVGADAYYVTINGVLTADNLDVPVCALDRAKMLTGAQATRQCFSTAARGGVPTPADFTGGTAPPAGTQELVAVADHAGNNIISTWKLHVDWTTPANSTLTGPTALAVAASTGAVMVTQPGTTNTIAPGGNAFPLAYRNFGGYESYVFADMVSSGGVSTVRWYELRNTGGTLAVYQQGTFAPGDGLHRFMPSSSIDKYGNIAIGYSVSNSTVYPGIRFAGHASTDPLGTMGQGEGTIVAGTNSQINGNRWGDYSAMSIDPADDCTFWYSQEYIGDASGSWRTRVASFRLPNCAGAPPPPAGIVNGDFETGAITPWTVTGNASIVTPGHAGTYALVTGAVGGATNGDSAIAQSFTAPTAGGALSFYYKVVCPDTVTYDWATATLKDNTAGTTTTMLAKTCTNTNAWVKVSANVVGDHNYTLTLTSHDDNYAGDGTYAYWDDVAIAAAPPPPPPGITNGTFETGALTPWTSVGSTSISTTSHAGTYAALGGKVGVTTKGDSAIAQSFTASSSGGTLSFYYKVMCLDSLTYDWATATLKDTTTGTTSTILAKTCNKTGTWVKVSATLVASHGYTLTLTNHDDGYSNADATYTLFDDVAIN